MARFFAVTLIFLSLILVRGIAAQQTPAAEERSWLLLNGNQIRGVYEPLEGDDTVRIRAGQKIYELNLADLAPEDQEYVKSLTPASPEPEVPEPAAELPVFTAVSHEDFNLPGREPGDHRSLLINGIEFRFCWCPPGTFMMGSPENEQDHENYETLHEVTLTRGFWLLETEVTQQLWQLVTGRTIKDELTLYQPNVGGVFEPDEIGNIEKTGFGNTYPIYFISWKEAEEFCRILSEKTGLSVALPTEAQWEYACRAGSIGPFAVTQVEETSLDANGIESTRLSMIDPADMCWYFDNSKNGVQPVKQREPNAWKLYDMHGNLWEMCADRYSKDYYAVSPGTDPQGPQTGEYRVNRGGCWFSYLKFCRSACRYRNAEDYRYKNLGFRIAINPR
ncbi:MAG: SUMF1/EgtB/PvdO family nonheme iron enzyme [Thermoguttaceae bacterium]|nr:SUMF1/EgtB/PvdO family nonheme iron enzyme [Thermoguttaceae bacterium]